MYTIELYVGCTNIHVPLNDKHEEERSFLPSVLSSIEVARVVPSFLFPPWPGAHGIECSAINLSFTYPNLVRPLRVVHPISLYIIASNTICYYVG